MAHFAKLDENNVVTQVIVVNNNDCSVNGVESETVGILFCKELFGQDTKWKQTSYNGKIRKNYASVGYTYDETRDAFLPPKPFNSWVLNETTCRWEAPVEMPQNGNIHTWDEQSLSWKEV